MQWHEIIVHTTSQAQEIISELLIDSGAKGTSILDRSYIPDITKPGVEWELYDQNLLDNMPEDVEIHAWFDSNNNIGELINSIKDRLKKLDECELGISLGTLNIEYNESDDSLWKDKWKNYFKPLHIGDRIVIKPSWEKYEAKINEIIIEIDPGMAFGSGTHATTYMCIELLEKYVTKYSDVIDIGTGSGILAIASALLGANSVLGLDINKDAVIVAKKNVNHNNLSDKINIIESDLLNGANGKYNIAVANIIADAVIMLTNDVTKVLEEGSIYIVSGILQEREIDVINKAEASGFITKDILHKDEWSAIAFVYRGKNA